MTTHPWPLRCACRLFVLLRLAYIWECITGTSNRKAMTRKIRLKVGFADCVLLGGSCELFPGVNKRLCNILFFFAFGKFSFLFFKRGIEKCMKDAAGLFYLMPSISFIGFLEKFQMVTHLSTRWLRMASQSEYPRRFIPLERITFLWTFLCVITFSY